MTEPLTDEQLREHRQMADDLASYRVDPKDPEANFRYHDHIADYPPEDAIKALLDEIARLKANESNLVTLLDQSQADRVAILTENDRIMGRLAFEAEAYSAVNDHKNSLLRSGRMLVSLAKEVAKEYEDAADWKDDRGRLQRMAQDALDEIGIPS